jgi:prepilin-type N-terminal cleavage/methylation domain-containing protein/prepilin-type processing-associated H-X9-DG protein
MRSRSLSTKFRSAFTLVELLIVIAIIALLMALLAPALSRAHQQAQNIVCMTNMKAAAFDFQIALNDPAGLRRLDPTKASPRSFGLTSYIDRFFNAGAYYPDSSRDRTYRRGRSSFICPSAPYDLTVARGNVWPAIATPALGDDGAIQPQEYVSYGFNARLYRIYRGANPELAGATPWYVSLGQSFLTSSDAGRTVLLSDFDGELAAQVPAATPLLLAPPIEPQGFYGAEPGNTKGLQWFPSFRHGGRCNAALIDGSVISEKESDLLNSPTRINWADAGYDGFWRDGEFIGSGNLTSTVLFGIEALDTQPVQ